MLPERHGGDLYLWVRFKTKIYCIVSNETTKNRNLLYTRHGESHRKACREGGVDEDQPETTEASSVISATLALPFSESSSTGSSSTQPGTSGGAVARHRPTAPRKEPSSG